MTKKYSYVRGERRAEREIDNYLKDVNYAAAGSSILGELKALWAVK